MSKDEVEFSGHTLRYDRTANIVYMHQVGELTLEDTVVLMDSIDAWLGPGANLYMISNASKGMGVSPKARAYLGERTRKVQRNSWIAVHSASFAMRVITNLLFTAIRLLGQSLVGTFEGSEEAAVAWLKARQAETAPGVVATTGN